MKYVLLLHKLEEISVPHPFVIVLFELSLTLGFKEIDGLSHDLLRLLIGATADMFLGIEQHR